jgi:hypothetical protein
MHAMLAFLQCPLRLPRSQAQALRGVVQVGDMPSSSSLRHGWRTSARWWVLGGGEGCIELCDVAAITHIGATVTVFRYLLVDSSSFLSNSKRSMLQRMFR